MDIYVRVCNEFTGDISTSDKKIWESQFDKCALNKLTGLFED